MARNLFSCFNEDAKLTIYFALVLASHRRRKKIDTDDLLIALTWRQHAPECAFRKLKDDFAAIWERVGIPHLPITVVPYQTTPLSLSRQANRVVRRSVVEADRDGEYWVDIDHMLRAILHCGGQPAKALQDAGWSHARIVAAGVAARALYPSKATPFGGLLLRRLRPFLWIALALLALAAVAYLRSQNNV